MKTRLGNIRNLELSWIISFVTKMFTIKRPYTFVVCLFVWFGCLVRFLCELTQKIQIYHDMKHLLIKHMAELFELNVFVLTLAAEGLNLQKQFGCCWYSCACKQINLIKGKAMKPFAI